MRARYRSHAVVPAKAGTITTGAGLFRESGGRRMSLKTGAQRMGPCFRRDDCHDDGDGEYRHRGSTDACSELPHFVAPPTRGPQRFLQDSLACGLDRRHPMVVGKIAVNR